jgi:hypothetical protein
MSRSGLQRAIFRGTGLLLVPLLAAGCGWEKMPKTYSVKGKVVTKSGKPFPGGDIVFTSVTDPELRGYGLIEKDGTFKLNTIGHTSKGRSELLTGAVEGDFYVNIRPAAGSGGGPPPGPGGGGQAAFTLKKTYKIEAKENNEITVVVE